MAAVVIAFGIVAGVMIVVFGGMLVFAIILEWWPLILGIAIGGYVSGGPFGSTPAGVVIILISVIGQIWWWSTGYSR
jgi:hypothetical protein